MGLTKYPNGVSSFGIPILGSGPIVTTGNVFFVDDSGSNSNSGDDPSEPFADLDYAIGKCTASQGDIIILMPGHAETANTQITCDIAGIRIVGLGVGRNRPTITAHASVADCFNVTAANVSIENIRIYGAASCTALINVAAADFHGYNLSLESIATPLNVVTVTSAGSRFKFERCKWLGGSDGADNGILIEGDALNWEVVDCVMDFSASDLDVAGIGSAFKSYGGRVHNCQFIGMKLTVIDFDSSNAAVGDGIISDVNAVMSTGVTIANAIDLGGYGAVNVKITDSAGAKGLELPGATPD